MKTKIIPFDINIAKQIQAEEIEGKIKTRKGASVRVVAWDMKSRDNAPILVLVDRGYCEEVIAVDVYGREKIGSAESLFDLVLEVPDNEPQFAPFDKVLVRNEDHEAWNARLYDVWFAELGLHGTQDNKEWKQCVPYEGNEYLVGTTHKPKKE